MGRLSALVMILSLGPAAQTLSAFDLPARPISEVAVFDLSSVERKPKRATRDQVIIMEQERLRMPVPTISPSAGGSGRTYSDRIVGCTHGAGVAGISGADRGPAIHNCAFGR